MTETITHNFQGTSYKFLCDAKRLEFNKSVVKIKKPENIKKIVNESKINEQILVDDSDIINSRHINNYLFNLQYSTIKITQLAWNVILDEIIDKYSSSGGVELQGLTIWDESLGTVSEGYIFSSEEMKHYEDQPSGEQDGENEEMLVATTTVWNIIFIEGNNPKVGKPALQRYIVKVVEENDTENSGIIPNFLPMICERGMAQFGKFSKPSALEFFQFNGKKATRSPAGRGKGKGLGNQSTASVIKKVGGEDLEELDYEASEDDFFLFNSVSQSRNTPPIRAATNTPANTPVVPFQNGRIIGSDGGVALGTALEAMNSTVPINENPSKKRKIIDGVLPLMNTGLEQMYDQIRAEFVQEQAETLQKVTDLKKQETLLVAEKKALLEAKESAEIELSEAKDELEKEKEKCKIKMDKLKLENEEMKKKIKDFESLINSSFSSFKKCFR